MTILNNSWVAVRIPRDAFRCAISDEGQGGGVLQTGPLRVQATTVSIRQDSSLSTTLCDSTLQSRSIHFDLVLQGDKWNPEVGNGQNNDVNRALVGGLAGTGAVELYIFERLVQPKHLERLSDTVVRIHLMPWPHFVIQRGCYEELALALSASTTLCKVCVALPESIRIYSDTCVERDTEGSLVHRCSGEVLPSNITINATTQEVYYRGRTWRVTAAPAQPSNHFEASSEPRAWFVPEKAYLYLLCYVLTILCPWLIAPHAFSPYASHCTVLAAALCCWAPQVALHIGFVAWIIVALKGRGYDGVVAFLGGVHAVGYVLAHV